MLTHETILNAETLGFFAQLSSFYIAWIYLIVRDECSKEMEWTKLSEILKRSKLMVRSHLLRRVMM